jgi:hypothetical protein
MSSPGVPATTKVFLAGTIAKGLLAEVAEGLSPGCSSVCRLLCQNLQGEVSQRFYFNLVAEFTNI